MLMAGGSGLFSGTVEAQSIPSTSLSLTATGQSRILAERSPEAGGQSFAGQSLNNTEAETYSLRGTVVNSVTGEGVSGALVRSNSKRQRAVRTDAAGKFEIAGLAAGTTSIQVSKPGYFGTDDLPHEVPALNVEIGADTGVQIVKLTPEGIIYGRISGADGEPVSGIQIQILQQRVMNGWNRRVVARSMVTDDEGRFRAAELHPGKYFLMAGPENFRELANGADSSTTTQYGAMFYPGVSEFSEAAVIQMAPGQRVETDFKLVQQPLYRVSGVVSGGPPGCQVALAVLNDIGQGIGHYFVDPNTGGFDAANVPSGASRFAAICYDKSERAYSGVTAVKLTSDVTNLRVTLVPWVDIPIRVRKENTNGGPSGGPGQNGLRSAFVGVSGYAPAVELLAEQDSVTERMEYYSEAAGKDDDTSQVLKSVPPGRYDLRGLPSGRYYVEAAQAGTVDLFRDSLNVSGGTVAPVEIVLRDDAASLTISPVQDGAAAVATLVVWTDEAPRLIQERRLVRGTSVRLNRLRPGNYRVLAFSTDSEPEYRNPEFLQKYAAQRQEITLAANQDATLKIELAKGPE